MRSIESNPPADRREFERQAKILKENLSKEGEVRVDNLFTEKSSIDTDDPEVADLELRQVFNFDQAEEDKSRPFDQMGLELTMAKTRGHITGEEERELGMLMLLLGMSTRTGEQDEPEDPISINPDQKRRLLELANNFIANYQALLKNDKYQENFSDFELSIANLERFIENLDSLAENQTPNRQEDDVIPIFTDPVMQQLFDDGRIDAQGKPTAKKEDGDIEKLKAGLTADAISDIEKALSALDSDDPNKE